MKNIHLIFPEVSRRYISLTEKDQLRKALKKNTRKFKKTLKNIPEKKRDFAYAEGKWTIRQMLQHIIDAERVFVYRALWFARKDTQPLPGFDENAWADHAPATSRHWDDLVKEFKWLRRSTESLFASLSEEELNATGLSNNNEYSVAAFGYICAGHVAHHIGVINERYLA